MNYSEKFDLEISSHKVLLNMEMFGTGLIISRKKVLVGSMHLPIHGLQILNEIKTKLAVSLRILFFWAIYYLLFECIFFFFNFIIH
jgi:hypothetical protein